jgi:hypothetical protein
MRSELLLRPTNAVSCCDCPNVGQTGTDDATGKPIAWCRVQRLVVAPEFGCDRHPDRYSLTRKDCHAH